MYLRLPIRKRAIASLLVMLCLSTPAVAESRNAHQVNDLAYGVSLYHFFQDRYFSAITDLMIAKERKPIEKQGVYPELLLGSLALSYGLHDEARTIFEPLLAENTPPEVRDRAWFNLGKLRYQRGFLGEAEQDLARIQGSLPDYREAERLNLLANIYLKEQQYDKAIETLRAFSGDSTWKAYARFNLGVALIRQKRFEEGLEQLRKAGELKPRTKELAALRDKANLAAGYALMKMDRPADAIKAFQEVRLNGPQSNKALLGIGWALSKLDQYDRALTPWMELRSRSPLDPAAQESLLAIPYTFEKTGRPKLALAYYEEATQAYDAKLKELDRITQAIKNGELLQALKPGNLGDETAVSLFRAKLPPSISAPYLKEMMATHEFQEAVKNYQDLIYLDYALDRWQDNLPTFELMLKERRALYQQKLPEIDKNAQLKTIQQFQKERDALAREVARIDQSNDVFALANDEERDMLDVLNDIENRLGRLSGQRNLKAQQEKYQLFQGILYWQISSDSVPRLWRLKKGLKDLDRGLDDARAAEASLKTAWQQAPRTFEGFEARISGQQARIDRLKKRVATSRHQQEQQLQNLALDAIKQYRRRLNSYQIRSRFALARILDTMNKAGTP
jgi:tetratricopeptide (TPR) repeat protein